MKVLCFLRIVLLTLTLVSSVVFSESRDVWYTAASDNSLQHGILFYSENVKPQSALLFVHGLQSHAEWLRASGVGEALAEAGVVVFAYDRRGSGRSSSQRGHAHSAKQLLEDLQDAEDTFRVELSKDRRIPDATVFEMHVMANCFGARIVVPYLVLTKGQGRNPFSSLLLIAPSTHMTPKAEYSASEKLSILLKPKGVYVHTPLKDEWFVSQGPALDWIRNDDLGLRQVTVGFLKAANSLTKTMQKNIYHMDIPLLVLTATQDVMVDSRAVKQELYIPYRGRKRLVEIESEHSLEFGIYGRKPFIQSTVDWIGFLRHYERGE